MAAITKKGFEFGFDKEACESCGARCCRGKSGHVWVNQSELNEICAFLKTNPFDFIQKYLYRIDNRYSVKERFAGNEFECLFLEKDSPKKCSIYPVRPRQCRDFPFWKRFVHHPDEALRECPGVMRYTPGQDFNNPTLL